MDDLSCLSEGRLNVSKAFPAPPLFSPGNLSFHASPTVWCHGRPHLSLPGHLPALLSCPDYLPSVSQAKSFFWDAVSSLHGCPFSWEASPCLHLGGVYISSLDVPMAPCPPLPLLCSTVISLGDMLFWCVCWGPRVECDTLNVGAENLSEFISLAFRTGRATYGELKSLNGKCMYKSRSVPGLKKIS